MNRRTLDKLHEWLGEGRRVALVTIVETVGSTPRKAGASMLVTDRLELHGTIGGGCVEADAILAARECLRSMAPRLVRVDIKAKNPDEIDMLCGGEIALFVEPIMPDHQLVICGGGHISKAIAHVAHGLDLRVTVVDDRAPYAAAERFPTADAVVCAPYDALSDHVKLGGLTFVVIVTRGHSGDEACLRAALATAAPYIAMVGSRSKWTHIRARLRDDGFDDAQLARVRCPAGLDIGSITPEEIAVSIVAEVIRERARLLFGDAAWKSGQPAAAASDAPPEPPAAIRRLPPSQPSPAAPPKPATKKAGKSTRPAPTGKPTAKNASTKRRRPRP